MLVILGLILLQYCSLENRNIVLQKAETTKLEKLNLITNLFNLNMNSVLVFVFS